MTFDLVVRNGTVVDGSGLPRYRADVGISGGRIATIGRISEFAKEQIDAEGHFVAPGFIDGHTHLDAQVHWDPLGLSGCLHGVTSAVMGNCGFTVAPGREKEKDLALRSVERAEDIDRRDVLAGVNWSWETFPEYLDAVQATPKGINYAAYIGHSALRAYVMGERAFEETAGEDDLAAMAHEIEDALRAGAIGFSTSRSSGHMRVDDGPVASRLATWEELDILTGVLGTAGRGIFQIANEIPKDDDERADYFGHLIKIAVATGRPVHLPIVYVTSRPEMSQQLQQLLDDAFAAGGRMVGQVSCRELLSVIGFPTNLPFDQLPAWQEVRRRPAAEQRAALANPELRAQLVREAEHGHFAEGVSTQVRAPRYEVLRILDRPAGPYRTVADVAAERGMSPVEVMIDLSLDADLQRFFAQPFGNDVPSEVLTLLRNPRTVLAASDTGAHVSQIIDSSLPTYLLGHWVREEQAFTWEEAIRMLTSLPARTFGFHDRGLVEEGRAADLVIFDPASVGPDIPGADRQLPAGGVRLTQAARGILATVVNGEVLLRDGVHTGSLPGRLLRGSAAREE